MRCPSMRKTALRCWPRGRPKPPYEHKPPYEIAAGIERSEVDRVNEVTLAELRTEAVPATFVVDASGRVLLARWGVPTISVIKKFLWQDQAKRVNRLSISALACCSAAASTRIGAARD